MASFKKTRICIHCGPKFKFFNSIRETIIRIECFVKRVNRAKRVKRVNWAKRVKRVNWTKRVKLVNWTKRVKLVNWAKRVKRVNWAKFVKWLKRVTRGIAYSG